MPASVMSVALPEAVAVDDDGGQEEDDDAVPQVLVLPFPC